MNYSDDNLTREEFLRMIFAKAVPILLLLTAIIVSFSIYISSNSISTFYKIFLLIFVLVLFGYPIFKIYLGNKISKNLPSAYDPLLLLLKIIGNLVLIFILLFLGLNMPLLLVIFCISLLVDNNNSKNRIKRLESKISNLHPKNI